MMFKRTLLAFSIQAALMAPAWCLDALSDETLGEVSGQEGIQVEVQATSVNVQNAYWRDGNVATDMDLRVNQLNISPVSMVADIDIGASTNTVAGVPSIGISATIDPLELKSVAMRVANNAGSTNTFGLFAVKTTLPTTISYFNTNGLFDGTGTAGRFAFKMEDADWYLAQPRCLYTVACTPNADSHGAGFFSGNGLLTAGGVGDYNVLAFKDFTVNALATGQFTVDAVKGFNFGGGTGILSFPRLAANKAGFQMDVGVLTNIDFSGGGSSTFNFLDVTAVPSSYWHFGFSGNLMAVDMSLKGDIGTGIGTGFGSSGIKFSPKFEFARSSETNPFELEMGEPGGSLVRFSNWAALADGAAASPSRAVFNMGDIYLNLLAGAGGGGLSNFSTPATNTFSCVSGTGCVAASSFGATPVSASSGENAIAIAARNFELQGGARTISFADTTTGNPYAGVGPQTWALMPNFYGLNFNLLMYPSGHPGIPAANNRHGTGFDLTIETTGKNTAYGTPSTKGTHLIVADTAANKYVGFTNIDSRYSLLQSQFYVADTAMDYAAGSGLDVSGLRLTSKNMSFDIRAGLAIGDLPDGTVGRQMRDDDSVFGIRWKFGGDFSFTFSPPPTPPTPATQCPNQSCTYIGISSRLVATDMTKNGVYIVEPVDGTRIEWIDITGTLNMLSEHVPFATDGTYEDASRIDVGVEAVPSQPGPTIRPFVTFATAFELAPGTTQADADVIRIRKLNLYRPPATNAVFTGAGSVYKEGVDWKPGFNLAGTAAGGATGRFYTLGEMVITGGRFYGEVNLKVQ